LTSKFSQKIIEILNDMFGDEAREIYEKSSLLQYMDIKTRSADRGSKARGSFANLYAIYVLVEDYIEKGFIDRKDYSESAGAMFSKLFQRQLPFGTKLQNHALNHRLNQEFHKYFPRVEYIPILRDVGNNRYWINENLIKISTREEVHNIAEAIIIIIDEYVKAKQSAFRSFIEICERLKAIDKEGSKDIENFIYSLLETNVDARIFEIVSYAILKYFYYEQTVYFGFELDKIEEENLKLYKTGRTNANDGGIDFVMTPLGRFFQVTETLDVKKYFLDIDKIERYPIAFVIKSNEPTEYLLSKIEEGAKSQYGVSAIVMKYMGCVEEIINIPILKDRLKHAISEGHVRNIIDEIITQSKVEFNIEETDENDDEDVGTED